MRDPRSILITGASSGIGAALAAIYAAPGVRLVLGGRDEARLEAVAMLCRQAGAAVEQATIDVTNREALIHWATQADVRQAIDLCVVNAGISAGTAKGWEQAQQTHEIFAVNLEGACNTALAVIPPMLRRGRGQIALMSSLASFRGFPGAPAYCASKAALRVWGEALRGDLWDAGIRVSVICPGYVESPMTARNDFPMPFLMPSDRAARIIKRGLGRDRARIAFPWPLYFGTWLLSLLPPGLTDPLLRNLPKKA
jgi:short-subunit dehydrogenase